MELFGFGKIGVEPTLLAILYYQQQQQQHGKRKPKTNFALKPFENQLVLTRIEQSRAPVYNRDGRKNAINHTCFGGSSGIPPPIRLSEAHTNHFGQNSGEGKKANHTIPSFQKKDI